MEKTKTQLTISLDEDTVIATDGTLLPGVITSVHELIKAGYSIGWPSLPGPVTRILEGERLTGSIEPVSGASKPVTKSNDPDDAGVGTGTGMGSGPSPAPIIVNGQISHKNRVKTEMGHLLLWSDDHNVPVSGPHTDWPALTGALLQPPRIGQIHRNTRETRISIDLNLDGTGAFSCNTGLGFFDHMLEQIARHGDIDLDIRCEGDLHVDEHHTVEDVALALGSALDQAFGDRRGIERYGFVLPMDESRATVAIDLSGRPYLVFEAGFKREKVGDLPTEMVRHFFYSLAMNLKATLHVEVTGDNDHHMIEACFKGLARCLKSAKKRTGTVIPSSKGVL